MALTQISTQGIKDGTITGSDLATSFATTGDFTLTGASYNVLWDKSDNALEFADNAQALFGTGADLRIYHNGTHSFIQDAGTGNLEISSSKVAINNAANNANMATFTDGGAVALYHNGTKKFETISSGVSTDGLMNFNGTGHKVLISDNGKITLGGGLDLQIFHDGSFNKIQGSSAGNHLILRPNDSDEGVFIKNNDAVEIFFDGSKKFETFNDGIKITGDVYPEANNTRDLGSDTLGWNSIWASTRFRGNDNVKLILGNAQDLEIYHDGSNSYVADNGAGELRLASFNGNSVRITKGDSETLANFNVDGGCELFHDNSKKFDTTTYGVKVTGRLAATTSITGADNVQIKLGDSDDLKIYSDGTNGILQGGGSGANAPLFLNFNTIRLQTQSGGEKYIDCQENGAVELYFNNAAKLTTTSSGVTVLGTVIETSDIALKSNIQPLTNTLEKLQQITGYKYNLMDSISPSMGVIAQDVEKVFPELVHGSEGKKSLQYSGLIGVLVEAIKELSAEVAALKAG